MENAEKLTMEEMLAKMEALKVEIQAERAAIEQIKEDARRYRREAQSALANTRTAAGLAVLEGQKKSWVKTVPAFAGGHEYYDAGESAYLMYRNNSNRAEYDAYCATLVDTGLKKHLDDTEGTGISSFYYNKDAVVSVYFSTHDNVLRAVVEPAAETALVPKGIIKEGNKPAAPCLVQLNDHLNDVVDCGMCYIFRLADGSFIIFDGGWCTDPIADAIYDKLTALAEGGDVIISGWFFTHAHIDHIGAIYRVAQKYGSRMTVKRVIYNYPGESRMTEMGDEFVRGYVRRWHAMLKDFGDVDVIKARTGQRYLFDGLELDMLFTYEDYKMPRPLRTFNDTSLVFRITTMGQTYMFLGDASVDMCGILVAKYGEGMVSDIVQVAHHGYWGGTKEVYDAIRAPIVLWPVPADHPQTGAPRYSDPEWSPVTREMIRNYATAVYPQCEGTRTWLLPLDKPEECK